MASLIVNGIASFSQTQIVNVLSAQLNDAVINDWLSETSTVSLFDTEDVKEARAKKEKNHKK